MNMVTSSPGTDYYCKNCKNHIGIGRTEIKQLLDSELEPFSVLEPESHDGFQDDPHTFADVKCANSECKEHIGYKYIAGRAITENLIRKGDFLLKKEKVFYRSHGSSEMAEAEAEALDPIMEELGLDLVALQRAEKEVEGLVQMLEELKLDQLGLPQNLYVEMEASAGSEGQNQDAEMGVEDDEAAAGSNKRKAMQDQRDNNKMQKREDGSGCSSRPQ